MHATVWIRCQLMLSLHSLRWFSQRRSPTPHFGGAYPGGLWPPNSNSAETFVQCTYPKCHHPMFTCSEVIVLTNKQTNRRYWKHPHRCATTLGITMHATVWIRCQLMLFTDVLPTTAMPNDTGKARMPSRRNAAVLFQWKMLSWCGCCARNTPPHSPRPQWRLLSPLWLTTGA